MKPKILSWIAAGMAAAVFSASPVQASSVISAVPQAIQAETNAAAKPSASYFGSEVLEAYTYNPKNITYHRITDQKQLALLLNLLENNKTAKPKAASEGGFLLVTANGRHEIYIDSQEKELLTLCRNNNAAQPGLVKWLVFMDTSKITHGEFTDENTSETEKGRGFITDEAWALTELSNLLKSIQVKGGTRSRENPRTGGLFLPGIDLEFNTDVSYSIGLYGNEMEMWSSDMDYHIVYSLKEEETERIYKALREIGKKNPTYLLPIRQPESKAASVRVSGSWDGSSFYMDTKDSGRIQKILQAMGNMRVYGVGCFTAAVERGDAFGNYNGFNITVSYQDGSSQRFQDINGELWVYSYGPGKSTDTADWAMYGYTFAKEDHKAFYDGLNRAAR